MSQDLQVKLLDVFNKLSTVDQQAVAAFSEFLLARAEPASVLSPTPPQQRATAKVPEPLDIARPAEERVVAAVKRLSRTYPMLDKGRMLGVTSDLVTQHVLQGREATGVIDELERTFLDEYLRLKDGNS
jgi:hypothetical protein